MGKATHRLSPITAFGRIAAETTRAAPGGPRDVEFRRGYFTAFTVSLTMRGVRKIRSSVFSLDRPVCLKR